MNAIAGFSQLLSAQAFGPIGNDRYQEYAESINESAQSLMTIMENMLLMSDLDKGVTELKDQAVDCGRETQRILALLAPDADVAGIQIAPFARDEWPLMAVDLRAFRQIMANLAGNAVRHAGRGATVHVNAVIAEGSVEFTVSDDGIGIARADLQRILQPFGDIEEQRLAHAGGLGLGLTVAKELSRLLGGSLNIETAAGDGLRATLSLPVSRLVGVSSDTTGKKVSA